MEILRGIHRYSLVLLCQTKFGFQKDMDFVGEKYYKYNRFLFCLTGEWPTLNRKDQLIRKCIVRFGLLIFAVVQALKVFTSTLNLNTTIETCTFFLPTLIIGVSYCSFIFNSKQVIEIFERITYDWYEIKKKEERKIIEKYTDEGKLYIACCSVVFLIFVIIILLCGISPVLLDIVMPLNETRPRRPLIPVEFFVDEEKYFCEILAAIYVLSIIQCVAGLTVLSALLTALQHACAMFSVVGYMLEHVFDDRSDPSCASAERDNVLFSRIIRCVKYHRRTIEFAYYVFCNIFCIVKFVETMNHVTQQILFMCMTLAIIMLGVAFLRILRTNMSEDEIDQMMISIIYVPITFSWVYFDCYVGQKVLDHSTQVLEKTCAIPWYLESVKVQKLSFFIMIRSMKPCHIFIGRFFVCTHEFFAQLLRISLSYATMIYSLQ